MGKAIANVSPKRKQRLGKNSSKDERVTGKAYLDVVIHEVTHCQFTKMPEITVNARSTELADILWELGFRWVDLSEK